MALFKVERVERGETHKIYTAVADSEDDAVERVLEGDIEPDFEEFEQRDADTFVSKITDAEWSLTDEALEGLGL